MGLVPMYFILLSLSGQFASQLWLLQYNPIPFPTSKKEEMWLRDTGWHELHSSGPISDSPDAILQTEISLSNIQKFRWPGPSSGSEGSVSIKPKGGLDNLVASHIQTVRLDEFNTLCSPVMAGIFASAKFSLPCTVPDTQWWRFASFQSHNFLDSI